MMQITELEVWKAAIDLAKRCYELSKKFPDSENYGLGYQLKRTVTNIPANVSAAASRKHGKESLRHLFRARDMIYEVESHIYLANRLDFISNEELDEMMELLNTSKRLLFGFIKYYKRSNNNTNNSNNRRKYPKNNNRSNNYSSDENGFDDLSDEFDDFVDDLEDISDDDHSSF